MCTDESKCDDEAAPEDNKTADVVTQALVASAVLRSKLPGLVQGPMTALAALHLTSGLLLSERSERFKEGWEKVRPMLDGIVASAADALKRQRDAAPVGDVRTVPLELSTTCPACGEPVDTVVDNGNKGRAPAEGCVSLCVGCGELGMFTADMKLRALEPGEFERLPGDLREQLVDVQAIVKEHAAKHPRSKDAAPS